MVNESAASGQIVGRKSQAERRPLVGSRLSFGTRGRLHSCSRGIADLTPGVALDGGDDSANAVVDGQRRTRPCTATHANTRRSSNELLSDGDDLRPRVPPMPTRMSFSEPRAEGRKAAR
jgi:hypothetical protein